MNSEMAQIMLRKHRFASRKLLETVKRFAIESKAVIEASVVEEKGEKV